MVIYHEKIHSTDPRLKRHIRHDSRSLAYPFDTTDLSIQTVRHNRITAILNQGEIGKCTAEAAEGTLGTEPYYNPAVVAAYVKAFGSFDDAGTDRAYSAEETLNGSGVFPPTDVGSDGLTAAQVLQTAGCIAGYTHTFSLNDALMALSKYPAIVGINWYNSMFTPDVNGLVTVDQSSGLAGGHEISMIGYTVETDLVEFVNSWGVEFGKQGHFFMKSSDLGILLSQQGDVTIFTQLVG